MNRRVYLIPHSTLKNHMVSDKTFTRATITAQTDIHPTKFTVSLGKNKWLLSKSYTWIMFQILKKIITIDVLQFAASFEVFFWDSGSSIVHTGYVLYVRIRKYVCVSGG